MKVTLLEELQSQKMMMKIADGNSLKLSGTKDDDGKTEENEEKNFHPFSYFFLFHFRRMKILLISTSYDASVLVSDSLTHA